MISEREAVTIREQESAPTIQGEKLVGTAVVYGQRSVLIHENGRRFYEIIEPGAFRESLTKHNITFTFRHNDEAEYGSTGSGTLRLTDDLDGLHFELALPPYATTLRERISSGAVKGMSFGFIARDVFVDSDGVRHVRQADLVHISPVYSPAYPLTRVEISTGKKTLMKKKLQLLKLDKA